MESKLGLLFLSSGLLLVVLMGAADRVAVRVSTRTGDKLYAQPSNAVRISFYNELLRWTNLWLVLAIVFFSWIFAEYRSEEGFLNGVSTTFVSSTTSHRRRVEMVMHWVERWDRYLGKPQAQARVNPNDALWDLAYRKDGFGLRDSVSCGARSILAADLMNRSLVPARVVLLLTPSGVTRHVAVETYLDRRWVVVDPSYVRMWESPGGRLLSKEDLKDPAVLRAAVAATPNYNPIYDYQHTAYMAFSAIPVLGPAAALMMPLFGIDPTTVPRPAWIDRPTLRFLFFGAVCFFLVALARAGWLRRMGRMLGCRFQTRGLVWVGLRSVFWPRIYPLPGEFLVKEP